MLFVVPFPVEIIAVVSPGQTDAEMNAVAFFFPLADFLFRDIVEQVFIYGGDPKLIFSSYSVLVEKLVKQLFKSRILFLLFVCYEK